MPQEKKSVTRNGEILSTFNENGSKRTPIQTALTRPLKEAIGKCFLLISGSTEKVLVSNDDTKEVSRAVYEVRTLSKATKLPAGTILTIKIKGKESMLTNDENQKLLLGIEKPRIVAFDSLSHWNFNNTEGLSAEDIRELNLTVQEAMKL